MKKLPDCYRGDSYGPVKVGVSLSAGSLLNCPEIIMRVRADTSKASPVLIELTKTSGRISVPSSTEVQFDLLPEETAPLVPGPVFFDIECRLPDGGVRTIRELDRKLLVIADVT